MAPRPSLRFRRHAPYREPARGSTRLAQKRAGSPKAYSMDSIGLTGVGRSYFSDLLAHDDNRSPRGDYPVLSAPICPARWEASQSDPMATTTHGRAVAGVGDQTPVGRDEVPQPTSAAGSASRSG